MDDDEAATRRRAAHLDEQVEELATAARALRALADEVAVPLQRVDQGLQPHVWEGEAATQARAALVDRRGQAGALARRLDGLADQAQHTANQLRDDADALRHQLAL